MTSVKLKSLLTLFAFTVFSLSAENEAKYADQKVVVDDTKLSKMNDIINRIVKNEGAEGSASGAPELFKIINGETQTTTKELPLQDAVTEATENKFRITCYDTEKKTIVASFDPTLLNKSASEIKTADGTSVLELAIKNLNGGDKEGFTYLPNPSAKTPKVNGKKPTHGHLVVAKYSEAFQKKFLFTIEADAPVKD